MTMQSTLQPQRRGPATVLSRLAAVALVAVAAFATAQTGTTPTTTTPTTTTPRPTNPTNVNNNNNFNRNNTNSRTNPAQNRTNGRSNSQNSRDKQREAARGGKKSRKKKETEKKSASGRATVQGQSGVAAAKRAKNAKAGQGAKPGNVKAALPMPQIQINPLITQTTLYFSPAQDRQAADSRFTSHLFLFNSETQPVDHLDIWLHYPPELVEPREVDFSPVKSQIEGEPVREVMREGGYVHLAVRFNTPANQLIQPLLNVNWAALGIATPVTLTIESPNGEPIGIYAGGKNLLEESMVGNEGLVAGEIALYDKNGHTETDDAPFRETIAGEDPLMPELKPGAGVRLGLVPKDDEVIPGEVSTIDVVLLNPQVANLDEIRFRLRYEPGAVEILDADENNFITTGVNIYDGGFHAGMPFDTHTRNEVDPAAGTIDYLAGMQSGPRGVASGTIARVVYRMKRDAGAATFWFEGLDPLTGRMVSDVRARGRSLLGNEEVRPSEALHNTQVAVAPLR